MAGADTDADKAIFAGPDDAEAPTEPGRDGARVDRGRVTFAEHDVARAERLRWVRHDRRLPQEAELGDDQVIETVSVHVSDTGDAEPEGIEIVVAGAHERKPLRRITAEVREAHGRRVRLAKDHGSAATGRGEDRPVGAAGRARHPHDDVLEAIAVDVARRVEPLRIVGDAVEGVGRGDAEARVARVQRGEAE